MSHLRPPSAAPVPLNMTYIMLKAFGPLQWIGRKSQNRVFARSRLFDLDDDLALVIPSGIAASFKLLFIAV
jgi:hypothetical protein